MPNTPHSEARVPPCCGCVDHCPAAGLNAQVAPGGVPVRAERGNVVAIALSKSGFVRNCLHATLFPTTCGHADFNTWAHEKEAPAATPAQHRPHSVFVPSG